MHSWEPRGNSAENPLHTSVLRETLRSTLCSSDTQKLTVHLCKTQ